MNDLINDSIPNCQTLLDWLEALLYGLGIKTDVVLNPCTNALQGNPNAPNAAVGTEQVTLIPAQQAVHPQAMDAAGAGNRQQLAIRVPAAGQNGTDRNQEAVSPDFDKSWKSRTRAGSAEYHEAMSPATARDVKDQELPVIHSHSSLKTCKDRKFVVRGRRVNMDVDPPLMEPREEQKVDMKVSVVSFDAIEYLQTEGEPNVVLDVTRHGFTTSKVDVDWKNQNINTPEASYKQQHGIVSFLPGETHKQITLELLDDPHWNLEAMQVRAAVTSILRW